MLGAEVGYWSEAADEHQQVGVGRMSTLFFDWEVGWFITLHDKDGEVQ